jgi:hypothetical protein
MLLLPHIFSSNNVAAAAATVVVVVYKQTNQPTHANTHDTYYYYVR